MFLQNSAPNVLYIELSGITTITSHMLNQAIGVNYITDELALQITYDICKYELNFRCLWSKQPKSNIGVIDLERIIIPLNLPDEVKQHLIFNCEDIFYKIETAICDMLDIAVPEETWNILTAFLTPTSDLGINNEGDYRIYEWVKLQRENNMEYAQRYTDRQLGI